MNGPCMPVRVEASICAFIKVVTISSQVVTVGDNCTIVSLRYKAWVVYRTSLLSLSFRVIIGISQSLTVWRPLSVHPPYQSLRDRL